jgi:hypothetical protein
MEMLEDKIEVPVTPMMIAVSARRCRSSEDRRHALQQRAWASDDPRWERWRALPRAIKLKWLEGVRVVWGVAVAQELYREFMLPNRARQTR